MMTLVAHFSFQELSNEYIVGKRTLSSSRWELETGGRQESRQEVVRKWNRKFCRTLAAGEPLPAFFADTGEAVTCHDTRGSVLAGVRQAAAVLRCGVKGKSFRNWFRGQFTKLLSQVVSGSPMLQVAPFHPGAHMHLNESPSSEHVPPLLQVASSHWLSPINEKKSSVRRMDYIQIIYCLLEWYIRLILWSFHRLVTCRIIAFDLYLSAKN